MLRKISNRFLERSINHEKSTYKMNKETPSYLLQLYGPLLICLWLASFDTLVFYYLNINERPSLDGQVTVFLNLLTKLKIYHHPGF